MSAPATAWMEFARVESKLLWRDPAALLIPIGLPLLFLVTNGLTADMAGLPELGGLPEFDAMLMPMFLAMIIALIGLLNLPGFLVEHRKSGWLRRLSVTPAHPAMLLGAQVAVSLALTVAGLVLALTVARLWFDVAAPRNTAGAATVLLLATAAVFAVGLVIAAVAPTENTVIAIGLVGFFGMLALIGGFGGLDGMPDWLITAGEHTPMGAATSALTDAWTGTTPATSQLAALVVTAAVGAATAARLFKWE